MIVNVHAGHAAIGGGAIGAVGILNESVEDRKVKDAVIKYLKQAGCTVYDCTVDKGTQKQVLDGIVKKCNAHKADLDVSIHLNSGANDKKGNGASTGVECYVYSKASKAYDEAERICANISALGYRNRGVKVKNTLAVLKNTKAPAVLVECCFVDDKDDADRWNADAVGKAIAGGILNKSISASTPQPTPTPVPQPSAPSKKSCEQIADEVIAGKWGTGAERKKRLTEAGYNADAIQSIVNSKLGKKAPSASSGYKTWTGYVNTGKGLNVRSSAQNLGGKNKLYAIPFKTRVTVFGESGGWLHVHVSGRADGWCAKDFISRS